MAKSSSLELDFFSMEKKESNINPLPPPVFKRRRSFRDLQGVITKMKPEVVKSVIGNVCLGSNNSDHLPISDPKLSLRFGGDEIGKTTIPASPMTIFYNGMVTVFDVSPNKAQNILKVAEAKSANHLESSSHSERNFIESLNGDLPISRKNSLQRFLEKRKERLITVSPYSFPTN